MIRIGHGYDVHRLVEGRDLILGGVKIQHNTGLYGHSDADVLLHAIMDSILGAAGLGDIGNLFPDNNPEFKDVSSLKLLNIVCDLINKKGYKVFNIDSTVVAQAPKISTYVLSMRRNIAQACNLSIDYVNVKATTEENLGFTGSLQGISAHAVCTISCD